MSQRSSGAFLTACRPTCSDVRATATCSGRTIQPIPVSSSSGFTHVCPSTQFALALTGVQWDFARETR